MAPRSPTPEQSDDDAPEALSFGSSKQAAKGAQDAVAQAQRAEKLKQKQRNRERDAALKQRKEQAKERAGAPVQAGKRRKVVPDAEDDESSGGESSGAQDDLQTRMERAMREAAEESSEDADMGGEDESAGSSSGEEDDEMHAEGSEDDEDSDSEMLEDQADDSDGDEDEIEPPREIKSSAKSKYLPDHLFKTAFAKPPPAETETKTSSSTQRPTKKRKRAKRSGKDIVLGCAASTVLSLVARLTSFFRSSKVIRTLPSQFETFPAASRTMVPPARANKFLNASLNVKGKAARTKAKGWERRPGERRPSALLVCD